MQKNMTRAEAIGIAREHVAHAARQPHPPEYVTHFGPNWLPHDWVVDAILAAANIGARRRDADLPDDDQALYDVLNRPTSPAEAEDAARSFFGAVAAARIEHGMPDVQVIVQARVHGQHGPRPVIASSYWGDVQANQLVLLARKYGEARADHEHALGDIIEQGRRATAERPR